VKPDVSRRKDAYDIFKNMCVQLHNTYITIHIYIERGRDTYRYVHIYICTYIYHTLSRWMHQLPDQGTAESSMIYGASELPNTGSLGDQISAEIVRWTHPDQILFFNVRKSFQMLLGTPRKAFGTNLSMGQKPWWTPK